jgi:hypothetical protein
MVRYPLGGNLSWSLQWLVGLHRLGHDVYLVEKSGYDRSCFDPSRREMSDDCAYGTAVVDDLLRRFGLEDRWCYVDRTGTYHGMSRRAVEAAVGAADLLLDIGSHGAWWEEASSAGARVYVDGEPGAYQMKLAASGAVPPAYDYFFTNGANIGTPRAAAPDAGIRWHHVFNPVVTDLFDAGPAPRGAPFTTVMNWQSHAPQTFGGRTYGQKDVEFGRFVRLPQMVDVPCEVAVAGSAPRSALESAGWRVREAHEVTVTYDSFGDYVDRSAGEFSVCKNVYVDTNSGWFSDRSAVYLASGRPVVLQDTGFSSHLPCGEGLFAVRTVEEAADAVQAVQRDRARHEAAARAVALEHLDATVVLGRMLRMIGI